MERKYVGRIVDDSHVSIYEKNNDRFCGTFPVKTKKCKSVDYGYMLTQNPFSLIDVGALMTSNEFINEILNSDVNNENVVQVVQVVKDVVKNMIQTR